MADSLRSREGNRNPYIDAKAEALGLSRFNMLCWRFAALVLVVAFTVDTGLDVYLGLIDKPPVDTVFVLVDEETRVLATAEARTWTFDEQARADIARSFIWHLRNRPVSDYATSVIRNEGRRITAERVVGKVGVMLREMDEKLEQGPDGTKDGMGLAVGENVETSIVGRDDETGAVAVRVDWQERTIDKNEEHVGPWQSMFTVVQVQSIEPTETAQVMVNGTGLYVVDLLPIGKRRPKADALAAVQ